MKIDIEDYIELGGCSKPHGIKGAFAFHLFNTEDSVLKKGASVLLFPQDGSKVSKEGEIHVISSIAFGNKIISTLKGIDNRNRVEEMLPFSIYFKKSDLPEPNEDEFYLEDLVGLTVLDESSGKKVGSISSYYDNTAQLILMIKGDQEAGHENFEIPYIDNFVKEIDFDAGTVKVVIPQFIGEENE